MILLCSDEKVEQQTDLKQECDDLHTLLQDTRKEVNKLTAFCSFTIRCHGTPRSFSILNPWHDVSIACILNIFRETFSSLGGGSIHILRASCLFGKILASVPYCFSMHFCLNGLLSFSGEA